jgi:hypothetical protein
MSGRDVRLAGPRALADGAGEPGPGLVDALHGAPALLAAIAAAPRDRNCLALRLVSRACCEAVDSAGTCITLAFNKAREQAGAEGAWLARMERQLAKLPRLEELACSGPSDVELGQLLAGPAAAGVQRLEVRNCRSGRGGLDMPGPSLADLPSLQVCTRGRAPSVGGRLQRAPA